MLLLERLVSTCQGMRLVALQQSKVESAAAAGVSFSSVQGTTKLAIHALLNEDLMIKSAQQRFRFSQGDAADVR